MIFPEIEFEKPSNHCSHRSVPRSWPDLIVFVFFDVEICFFVLFLSIDFAKKFPIAKREFSYTSIWSGRVCWGEKDDLGRRRFLILTPDKGHLTCRTLFLWFRPLFTAISPINSTRSGKMQRLMYIITLPLRVFGFFFFSFHILRWMMMYITFSPFQFVAWEYCQEFNFFRWPWKDLQSHWDVD